MAFDEQVVKDITAAAKKMSLEPEAMLAVVEVESGGKVYTRIGDKNLPLIRWGGITSTGSSPAPTGSGWGTRA